MSPLETRHYVATLEDVAKIARDVIAAQSQNAEGRATYLRALIATTQAELAGAPRQRAVSPAKLNAQEILEQTAVLEKVGKRFYDVVKKATKEALNGPDPGGLILNKRTNFARSSLSTVRKWIRRGNDITSLVASRVTKAALYTPGRKKGPSVKVLGNRSRKLGINLKNTMATFVAADRGLAVAQWERLRAELDALFRKTNGRRPVRVTAPGLRQSA